eukprot:GFUD01008662.1.p2 GENE.GFUD01008662.1~~GFUD01008662.1.p2  ORF type:complete len:325 (-),score=92.10 GFUD01008662.1:144-1118(-)
MQYILVENNDNSYTYGSQPNENTKESNNCQDKRPVGREEDEEVSESCDHFVNAAQNTHNDSVTEAYNSKLTRMQELVEDDIEEFENKRKNDTIIIENNGETTENLIVNNVKGVEFKSCIAIHQQLCGEYDMENNEDIFSDDESISSGTESVNSVVFVSSDVLTNYDEQNTQNMEQESEKIIESDNSLKEDNYHYELGQNLELIYQQDESKNNEDFNDLKMHLRKMPRKSSNIETKIREKELLSSLFKKSSKQTVEAKEQEKSQKKSQEKQQKSSMTIATLNENVKKETFKIRFKVRLNADSSKSSVLKYLFGCFGGEKIFHQTQ